MLKRLYPLLLIVLVGIAAYSNTFAVPFHFDDFANITDNPVVKDLGNFTSSPKGYAFNPRRYVGNFSFALNYRFGGLNVTGYHIVNLAIHIANALLVYVLVMLTTQAIGNKQLAMGEEIQKAMGNQRSAISDQQWTKRQAKGNRLSAIGEETQKAKGNQRSAISDQQSAISGQRDSLFTIHYSLFTIHESRLIALFSALLFVSHPIQTQAVTYIVQRFTSLATLFYLLAVVMYIKGRVISQAIGNGNNGRLWAIGNRQSVKGEEEQEARGEGQEAMEGRPIAYRLLPIAHWFLPLACFFSSLACAVLAMKTKEIAFTLPVVIVLCEFIFFKTTVKKKLLFLLPVALTLIVVPLSVMGTDRPLGEILSDLSEKTRIQTNIPRLDYFLTEMRVITTYIRLIFLPVHQNLDYDYPIYHSLFTPSVFLSFLFLAALFGLGGYLLFKGGQRAIGDRQAATGTETGNQQSAVSDQQENRQAAIGNQSAGFTIHYSLFTIHYYLLIGFGILWFFITLSVESSVIPIADVIFEHRAYLPSVGAFISIAAAVFLFAAKLRGRGKALGKAAVPTLVIVVVGLAGATYARNAVWQDDLALWQDIVAKSPGNARAHNDFGYVSLGRGMPDRAIEQFQAALRLNPYYADAHTNLGVAYYSQGLFYKAIDEFRAALRFTTYRPDIANAQHNLGLAYSKIGLIDDAVRELESAAAIEPGEPEVLNDLGVLYLAKGFTGKAIECYERALKVMPSNAGAHYNLGLVYESMGRRDLAAEHFSKAHSLSPERF